MLPLFSQRLSRGTLILPLLLLPLVAGCAPVAPTAPGGEAAPASLQVTFLPIADAVPFYVADQAGYFAEAGLEAEAVPASSAAERETLIQSGGADCELTDIHGVVLTNAGEGVPLRIVASTRQATAEEPVFFLLSAPESGITTPEQLAGANIGISENTVIEYWQDRILAAAGVDPGAVTRTSVPQIAIRLELLMSGQIDAAVLPDPLAALAVLQGAAPVLDDTIFPEAGISILACRADVIESRRDAVAALVAGWDRAIETVNADPAAYRNLLLERTNVPEPLKDRYDLPTYPVRQIPTEAQVADVVAWTVEKGLIAEPLGYAEIVDVSFRP
jgi:NitT/TauT family transport system substrate-binding protein